MRYKLKKLVCGFVPVLMLGFMLASCVPPQHRDRISHHSAKVEQAIADQITSGKSLREVVMPPAIVMVFGTLIPITGTILFFTAVIMFLRMQHKRKLLLLEKGMTEEKSKKRSHYFFFLLPGLLLAFTGIGVSIYLPARFGFYGWSVLGGVIPLCLGIAFIVFFKIYNNNLKTQ
ncbi:MAG TPA: hypothetical protein VKS21_06895 [Spirochaetota bacterium]|nr:hypothetical protein [Spirochaetota bacterium]